jgi:hypothetical protein
MHFGQATAKGVQVPPKWVAINLVDVNGVSTAQAQSAW